MIISKLRKFAWVFFALALATSTLFAQGYRNGNRVNNNRNGAYWKRVSGLTDQQKTAIMALEKKHQEEVVKLRDKRKNAANVSERRGIRKEMRKKAEAHKQNIKNLLTVDQKKQYNNIIEQQSNYRKTQGKNKNSQFKGNGGGRGKHGGGF
jgi:hypothetical protein